MIFGKLEDLHKYVPTHGHHPFFAELLKKMEATPEATGKYEIDEHIYYFRFDYTTKPEQEALWEAHRKYIDIHITIEGAEEILCNHISEMNPTNEYQTEGDYQLFEGKPAVRIQNSRGYFVLFEPHDVHKTAVQIEQAAPLKKFVVKVAL